MPWYLRWIPKVIHNITEWDSWEFLWNWQEISWWWGWWILEQWIWFSDETYLYVIYWIDGDWIVFRDTRDLVTQTNTWTQTWTKPITLEEVQWLSYN